MQQPEAVLFSAPVSDADAPGYSRVVSRPMDLGTIKGRLQRKQYQHPADVYADIRQVGSSPACLSRPILVTVWVISHINEAMTTCQVLGVM